MHAANRGSRTCSALLEDKKWIVQVIISTLLCVKSLSQIKQKSLFDVFKFHDERLRRSICGAACWSLSAPRLKCRGHEEKWCEPSDRRECERDEGAGNGAKPKRRDVRPVAADGRGCGGYKAASHGAPVQWLHWPEVVHHLVSGRVISSVELHRAQHFQLNV